MLTHLAYWNTLQQLPQEQQLPQQLQQQQIKSIF
jgi:hypothetical protein